MSYNFVKVPLPYNEPQFGYRNDSLEEAALKKELSRQLSETIEIPIIINGKNIYTGNKQAVVCPHDHQHTLGYFHKASENETSFARKTALQNAKEWRDMDFSDRAAIFLKAAELISKKYRYKLNSATMLGQSKTVMQAEIDSVCELTDFLRFNVHFMQEIYSDQNLINTRGIWNKTEYRSLEGFVLAITPFNFTAIAGNLPTAPALMGNTVIWKPASTSMLSSYYVMQILKEAGLPDGIINMIPGKGSEIGNILLNFPELSGVHFTGSTSTFNNIWQTIGTNLSNNIYKTYPRLIGETGGKDYIFACPDADIDALATAMIRGAFEYQGQKCSAASRAYIPKSIWSNLKQRLETNLEKITYGDVFDLNVFMGALIDRKAFDNAVSYIEDVKHSTDASILYGGQYSREKGYFISPTIILTDDPFYKSMQEEIFAPILSVYVYDDKKMDESIDILNRTSAYALTGAIFANDRKTISYLTKRLIDTAGNFYINDKPTGAMVGQQPFGGARMSGTNDKAGSKLNLLRWVSPRTIKENFNPPQEL